MPKALLDFYPKYCPNCGTPTRPLDQYQMGDYLAHASHLCPGRPRCQMAFQYAETEVINEAATSVGGDLAR